MIMNENRYWLLQYIIIYIRANIYRAKLLFKIIHPSKFYIRMSENQVMCNQSKWQIEEKEKSVSTEGTGRYGERNKMRRKLQ